MSWFVFLIWSVIAFGTHAKPASAQLRIFGGNATRIEDHRYQVALLLNNEFRCGGSLISSSIVLTAAHCVYGFKGEFTIRAGSTSPVFGGQIIKVRKLCTHLKFGRKYLDYDVSVLQLDHPVTLSNRVGIIELQPVEMVVNDGTEAVTTGWGGTENEEIASVLKSVTLKKISQNQCSKLNHHFKVTSRMTCYSKFGENAGVCYGDSGGPLVINGKQVGIASWVLEYCGDPKHPSGFVRIDHKLISQHIQECVKMFS